MNKKAILLVLILTALLTGSLLAMATAEYAIDWFVPLTGSGGKATSSGYSANVTIGQTVIGASGGGSYEANLGFWAVPGSNFLIFLPSVQN